MFCKNCGILQILYAYNNTNNCIRVLQEARDAAIVQRDKAISSEREIDQQLQELKSLLVL